MASRRKKEQALFVASQLILDKLHSKLRFYITPDFVKYTHKALYGYFPKNAGVFRSPVHNVEVTSDSFKPVHPALIEARILNVLSFMNDRRISAGIYRGFTKNIAGYKNLDRKTKAKLYILFCGSYVHHQFAMIHPFRGGNGRFARLMLSLELARHGAFKATFPLLLSAAINKSKEEYLDALSAADRGDLFPFVSYLAKIIVYSAENEAALVKEVKDTLGPVI